MIAAQKKYHRNVSKTVRGSGSRQDGGAGEAGAPLPDPPLLIGGLLQLKPELSNNISLTGGGIDYLTITLPQASSESMVARTEHAEPGVAGRGFRSSEKRLCLGGHCWRRWEPITSSKQYGTDYETWEFSGAASADPASFLLGKQCRPSRIDFAFDYEVPSDFYPVELESLIENHVEQRGTTIRYVGERNKQTVYVGSQKSDRMIRIYRRDEKNPLLAAEGRHILRVELVLKNDQARALWHQMDLGLTEGLPEAAAHILEMIGYAPAAEVSEIPDLIRTDEDTEAVQMLLQFVEQNRTMLKAIDVCGIDLASIVDEKIKHTNNRMQKTRLADKIQVLGLMDPDRLALQVVALCQRS